MENFKPATKNLTNKGNYKIYFTSLFQLKRPVEIFFDEVLVNSENNDLKKNRLALLNNLHNAMNIVADLSILAD